MAETSTIYAGVAGYFGKPDHPGKVGIFRRNVGEQWQHVLDGVQVFAMFVHPNDPELVLAGTNNGIWRSNDRGATFARTDFPDLEKEVWSFLVDVRNPKTILAGASPIDIYRSKDGGQSWLKLPTPDIAIHCSGPFASRVMRLAQNPVQPDEIYAALEINGVMRSDDGGMTWEDCSAGLMKLAEQPHLQSKIVSDTVAEGMLDGHAIIVSAERPHTTIVALRMGLFQTTDQGRTWSDMEMHRFSPITYGRDVKVSPTDPQTLYAALSVAAASHDGALYRSRDAGRTWHRFDKVQVHGTIMSIGLHNRDPHQVYIGARYNGEIFGTRDGGHTWEEMPLPGEVQHIYSIACG